jgi:hypothetical protein
MPAKNVQLLKGLAPFSELLIKVSPLSEKKVPVPMPAKNFRLLKGLAPFSALLNNFPTAPFPNTE